MLSVKEFQLINETLEILLAKIDPKREPTDKRCGEYRFIRATH